jgi:hypothetical protein
VGLDRCNARGNVRRTSIVEFGQQVADPFGVGVLDGFIDGQGLGPKLAGAGGVAQGFVGQAQVSQGIRGRNGAGFRR